MLESSWLGYCKLVSGYAHVWYQTRNWLFPLRCLVVSLFPLSPIPLPRELSGLPQFLLFLSFLRHSFLHGHNYKTRNQKFSKTLGSTSTLWVPKEWHQESSKWGFKNIRPHGTEFTNPRFSILDLRYWMIH